MSDPALMFAAIGGLLAAGSAIGYSRFARSRSPVTPPPGSRSVHPMFDLDRCIRSGACITACPEGDVIRFVDGVPRLVDATACVGHADCIRSCCVGAVRLVLGTTAHGVEIPAIAADGETSLPNVYVAGELGGVGLVHNAIAEGLAVVDTIRDRLRTRARPIPLTHDLVIVGAGPAGLAAALRARELGLSFVVLDKGNLGGAIRSFPRQKLVMTTPFTLPLHGLVRRTEISKEELLALWERLRDQHELPIHEQCEMTGLVPTVGGYEVVTRRGTFTTVHVVLALGRRGTPRRLDVPGEEASHVTYELLEPEQYAGRACAVIGGGDSAVEAALALAEISGTRVSLLHRRDTVSAKPKNQLRLDAARREGKIEFVGGVSPIAIDREVRFRRADSSESGVPADFTFVMVGGELPAPWLRSIGVEVETVHGRVIAVRS